MVASTSLSVAGGRGERLGAAWGAGGRGAGSRPNSSKNDSFATLRAQGWDQGAKVEGQGAAVHADGRQVACRAASAEVVDYSGGPLPRDVCQKAATVTILSSRFTR